MKPPIQLLGAALLLAAIGAGGSGCMLLRKGAAKIVTPVAMELSDGFMRQTDVELVREGAPAFLLMLDALAEAHPDKPAVLIAAAEAQMAYAMGFLDKAQKERAKSMFLKAKTYGLRALASRSRKFAQAQEGSYEDFVHALGHFRKRDADALLSTATSWVMWIIASSDSPAALGDMPKVLAMMERVKELDPRIRQQLQAFLGIRTRLVPHGDGAGKPVVHDQQGDRLALIVETRNEGLLVGSDRRELCGCLWRAEEYLDALHRGLDALAADGGGAGSRRNQDLLLRRAGQDRRQQGPAAQGMLDSPRSD